MNDKENNFIIQTCLHCGNRGMMKIEHTYYQEFGGPIWDDVGNEVDYDIEEHVTTILLLCPVCYMTTLYQESEDETTRFQSTDKYILYPQTTINYRGVPDKIKAAFEAALKVKNIDTSICLISLRVVLEAICRDKGAKGNNLEKMISDMIACKMLPEMFDDACWIIRQLGNSAAHADKQTFYTSQVNQTIGFMKTIINYLYTLPLEIKELKNRVIKDKKKLVNRSEETEE